MLLGEVLGRPELKLTILADHGRLDDPVTRVYVTDLPDPSRYLSGGEVVLTGLVWHHGPSDSERFTAALAAAGVVALGAGDAVYGEVPPDLVAACHRHRLTLFEVPVEVSFQAVVEAAQLARWEHRAGGLATRLGRHRDLVAAVAAGARLAELLPQLSAELGLACWVLTPTGRLVAGTGPFPPGAAGIEAELARAFLAAARLPGQVIIRRQRFALFRVPAGPEHPLAAWFLACAVGDGSDPAALSEAVGDLVDLAALERAQLDRAARVERRVTDQLRAELAAPAGPAELAARLEACGLDPGGTHLAVAASLAGLPAPAATATTVVEELVRPLSPAAAVTSPGGEYGDVLAIVPAAPDQLAGAIEELRRCAAALAPGLAGGGRLAIGVSSRAAGTSALPGAAAEAGHARQVAAGSDGQVRVIGAGEVASHLLLLAALPVTVREAFRERLLGPLLRYDRDRATDLVESLDTFLCCAGSWRRSAELLHVHVNTLHYRIWRVEQLTGRNLGRFEDRVDLFLALRLPALG